jgi:uncharacterized secreted protein with C-terminal beta-propeller domain
MNNTKLVKEAMEIIDFANKNDGFTAEISNTEIQHCLACKLGVSMTTGEISDIRQQLQEEEEEMEAEKAREKECLHMANMHLPFGGYWHNA